jgi:hypothetical protein
VLTLNVDADVLLVVQHTPDHLDTADDVAAGLAERYPRNVVLVIPQGIDVTTIPISVLSMIVEEHAKRSRL